MRREGPGPIIAFMAVAGGLAAANLQLAQPLIPSLAAAFAVDVGTASLLVAAAQVGFVIGLLVVVPRTTRWRPRWSVAFMFALAAIALLGVAVTSNIVLALVANLALGFACVAPQMLTPIAAAIARTGQSGRAAARVLTGIIVGGLVARVAAGWLAELFAWQVVYGAAAVLAAVFAVLAARVLAPLAGDAQAPVGRVLFGIVSMWVRAAPVRRRALIGLPAAAAMSVFWATYAAQLDELGMGPAVAGSVGLAAIAGTVTSPWGGRLVDRDHFDRAVLCGLLLLGAGYAVAAAGTASAVAVAGGAVLVGAGGSLVHAGCLASVLRLTVGSGHMRNSAYMTAFFCGSAIGTVLAALSYAAGGWYATIALGLLCVGASSLAVLLTHPRRLPHTQTGSV